MPARGQRAIGFLVLLLAMPSGSAAAGGSVHQPLGVLVSRSSSVWIGHERALPSTAFFPGDVISTGEGSSAVLKFRSGTSAFLKGSSEVALPEDQARADVLLRQGALIIQTQDNRAARVGVLGASVMVGGPGGFPAVCRIASVGPTTVVFADRGHVEIHGAEAPLILPAGKYAKLEAGRSVGEAGLPAGAGRPQATGKKAGDVRVALPVEFVQHEGQTAQITLKESDEVHWKDTVRTEKSGRVRIALLDGSLLNVGARSTMQIVQHEHLSQQTEIVLTLGRMRAEVKKIADPTVGHFNVKTQTAVIGVVGSILLFHATANFTDVFCQDGMALVKNINASIVGETTLHAGEFTRVPRLGPPGAAVHASSTKMQTEMRHTDVQAGGGATGPSSGAGRAVTSTAGHAVHVGTLAAGAAMTGAVVSKVGSATDALDSARSVLATTDADLISAGTQAIAAASAANNARDASTGLQVGVASVQNIISPITPGCGCK